jgi:hypothetical protein
MANSSDWLGAFAGDYVAQLDTGAPSWLGLLDAGGGFREALPFGAPEFLAPPPAPEPLVSDPLAEAMARASASGQGTKPPNAPPPRPRPRRAPLASGRCG